MTHLLHLLHRSRLKYAVLPCFFFLFSLGSTLGQGGGWTSGLLRGYFKVESRFFGSDVFFDQGGHRTEIPYMGAWMQSVYAQFGLLDRLDVNAYVPAFVYLYQDATSMQAGKSEKGLGDLRIGAKYHVLQQGPAAFSLGLQLGVPTSRLGEKDLAHAYRLSTGNGDFNTTFYGDIGLGLGTVYLAAGASYAVRGRGFVNELNSYVLGGMSIAERFFLKAEAYFINPLKKASNNAAYITYGGEVGHAFGPLNVSIGFSHITRATYTLSGASLFGGLAYTL